MTDIRLVINDNRLFYPHGYAYRATMVDVYRAYQHSNEWRLLTERVKKRDNNCCRECGEKVNKNGVVHHCSYDNWGKGDALEEADCLYVCKGCHTHLHKSTPIDVPFWAMTTPQEVAVNASTTSRMSDNFI